MAGVLSTDREFFVVGAVGPEATVKPRLFGRAVRAAVERLNEVEEEI